MFTIELTGKVENELSLSVAYLARDGQEEQVVRASPRIPVPEEMPKVFSMGNPWPNPGRGRVSVKYGLPQACHVRLEVYNLVGQLVAVVEDKEEPAGYHTAVWDLRDGQGRASANGVYFLRLRAGTNDGVKRSTVVR